MLNRDSSRLAYLTRVCRAVAANAIEALNGRDEIHEIPDNILPSDPKNGHVWKEAYVLGIPEAIFIHAGQEISFGDRKLGIAILIEGAKKGCVECIRNLGLELLEQGDNSGIQLLEEAIRKRDGYAAWQLAQHYKHGPTLMRSRTKYLKYLTIAASLGHQWAISDLEFEKKSPGILFG